MEKTLETTRYCSIAENYKRTTRGIRSLFSTDQRQEAQNLSAKQAEVVGQTLLQLSVSYSQYFADSGHGCQLGNVSGTNYTQLPEGPLCPPLMVPW